MQKKSVLPKNQNEVDLMQLASKHVLAIASNLVVNSGQRTCNTRHGEYVLAWRVMTVSENEL